MKRSVCILLVFFGLYFNSIAQDLTSTLYVQVNHVNNKPVMENLSCWLTDIETGASINPMRQQNGYYRFEVLSGHDYMFHFADMEDYEEISIPGGKKWQMTKTIIYDLRQKNKSKIDVFSLSYDTIHLKYNFERPNADQTMIRITLNDVKFRTKPNIPVSLISIADKKLYRILTDKNGDANFIVPLGKEYKIVLNDAMEYGEVPPIPQGGGMMGMKLEYTEAEINEKDENDTITQFLTSDSPTTDRVYVHLLLKDNSLNLLEGEEIFFDVVGSKKVYRGITDNKGIAKFLLPKSTKYILNFKYEREVDLLNYKNAAGYKEVDIEYHYMGSKVIEEYYETSDRDKDGFFKDFGETKISKNYVSNKYLKKTAVGYNLEMTSETPVSTPAFGDDKIFIPGPYYTKELICVEENTGKFIWGVNLDESGISSVVYSNGIVFVNTYSCTLYALDAKTGNLLWSKWLATIIFSTPAVSGNKVVTSYPNDLSSMNPSFHEKGDNFAIVCFSADKGEILWQNWLNAEILTTPVIEGNSVYATTHNGSLYKFNLETGELLKKIDGNFNSPVTFANNKLYISSLEENKEFTKVYNAETLELERTSKPFLHNSSIVRANELTSVQKMNHTGNQVAFYKGFAYKLEGSNVKCFEAESMQENWEFEIDNKNTYDLFANKPTEIAPAAFNDLIMVSSFSGKIYFLDYKTGKLLKKYNLGAPLFSQAIVNKGRIISGSANGKLITIDTKDIRFDGWYMLNGSPKHNAAKQ